MSRFKSLIALVDVRFSIEDKMGGWRRYVYTKSVMPVTTSSSRFIVGVAIPACKYEHVPHVESHQVKDVTNLIKTLTSLSKSKTEILLVK